MPWHIESEHASCPASEPFAVVKNDGGKVVACHMSRDAAEKHMAALYANEPAAARAEKSTAAINDLPDSAFAYIESGGTKDEQGRTVPRSKRHFPIHDAAHVRNALARAPQSPFGNKAMPKIRAAAKKMGIGEPADAQRAERPIYERTFALDDIQILRSADGHRDGRTVEAYAAVFDTPTEITDQHGHYLERIAQAAFKRTLDAGIDRIGVFYHHGLTIHGTPSDLGSVPIGSPRDIRADGRGLRTVTRYNESALADSVLEAIRNGDLKGYSFRGRIYKSNPMRVPPVRRGAPLPTVTRTELGLTEYGPTPTPAYAGAGILAIRSVLDEFGEKLIEQISHMSPATPEDPAGDSATPNPGLGTEDPRDAHSARQQLLRFQRALRDRGL